MFSVIIPVFNHRPYLHEAVLSAVRSRLVTEVLVADDGSTDRSHEILEYFARGSLSKVRNLTVNPRRNAGAHACLNRLAQAASNSWIAVLNSDDVLCAGRFEILSGLAIGAILAAAGAGISWRAISERNQHTPEAFALWPSFRTNVRNVSEDMKKDFSLYSK